MNDIFAEEILNTFNNLVHDVNGSYLLNAIAFVNKCLKITIGTELGDDIPVGRGSVDFEAFDDVGVVELFQDFYLVLKHVNTGFSELFEVNDLDRTLHLCSNISSFVNDATVTSSQLLIGIEDV